jgi:hypothetical protein
VIGAAEIHNLPRLRKRRYSTQGVYSSAEDTVQEPPAKPEKPEKRRGGGGKRKRDVGKSRLSVAELGLEASGRSILPISRDLDALTGGATAHAYELPYDVWWEHANGVLQKRADAASFVKTSKSIGLEAKATDSVDVCTCNPNSGCGEGCVNRLMFIECFPDRCPCKSGCTNRRFQEKDTYAHAMSRFNTREKGVGIRARHPIPQSALVTEYVGEVMTADAYAHRVKTEYAGQCLTHTRLVQPICWVHHVSLWFGLFCSCLLWPLLRFLGFSTPSCACDVVIAFLLGQSFVWFHSMPRRPQRCAHWLMQATSEHVASDL